MANFAFIDLVKDSKIIRILAAHGLIHRPVAADNRPKTHANFLKRLAYCNKPMVINEVMNDSAVQNYIKTYAAYWGCSENNIRNILKFALMIALAKMIADEEYFAGGDEEVARRRIQEEIPIVIQKFKEFFRIV